MNVTEIILTLIFIFSYWTVHDITYYTVFDKMNSPAVYHSALAMLVHVLLSVIALIIGIYLLIVNTLIFIIIFIFTAIMSSLFARKIPRALLGLLLDGDIKSFVMEITESYKRDNQHMYYYNSKQGPGEEAAFNYKELASMAETLNMRGKYKKTIELLSPYINHYDNICESFFNELAIAYGKLGSQKHNL